MELKKEFMDIVKETISIIKEFGDDYVVINDDKQIKSFLMGLYGNYLYEHHINKGKVTGTYSLYKEACIILLEYMIAKLGYLNKLDEFETVMDKLLDDISIKPIKLTYDELHNLVYYVLPSDDGILTMKCVFGYYIAILNNKETDR